MKICQTCGNACTDDLLVCNQCGSTALAEQAPAYAPAPANNDPYPINKTHKGFWALGFFFGFVGLILYFVFKNNKPRLAKSALKGFIAGIIFSVAFFVFYFVVFFGIGILGAL